MADLNDFLRQAAERRKQREQTSGRPTQSSQPTQPVQSSPPQNRPTPPSRSREPQVVLDAEIVEVPASFSVENRHLPKLRPAIGDSHLAQEVELADDKMRDHLKQVFDHSVGNLAPKKKPKPKSATPARPNTTTEAAVSRSEELRIQEIMTKDIVSALRNPKSVRTAFVLTEILQRKHF